jgi:hypothetical protein
MSVKYLVTSGCSFSSNEVNNWPHYLSRALGLEKLSWGNRGAGNRWISDSAIYQANLLLKDGVSPDEILLAVMWSQIDRKSLFCDLTFEHRDLMVQGKTPINFIRNTANQPDYFDPVGGFLEGSEHNTFNNPSLLNYKKQSAKFFPLDSLAIDSYECFLKLEWFCASKGITLVNLTINDLLHYPNSEFLNPITNEPLTKDVYPNVAHLYSMINFDQWIFYKETGGMFEYVKGTGLDFQPDGHHPSSGAHWIYVNNFIMPMLAERQII